MTPDQILQRTTGQNYYTVRGALSMILNRYPHKFVLMQYGNTLFLTTVNSPQDVTVNMDTVDTPQALASAMRRYGQTLAHWGIQRVHARIDNPQMLRFFHAAHIPVQLQGNDAVINLGAMK